MAIKKIKLKNKGLIKSARVKNDEFYTTSAVAKKMITPFLEFLKNKRIICPCDSASSEIYKFLKSKGLQVWNSSGWFAGIDYSNYDVVITNPAFSTSGELINLLLKNKKYFILIGSWLDCSCKFINLNKGIYGSKSFSATWTNTDVPVRIRFYSNIPDAFDIYKAQKGESVVSGVLYSVSCFDHTSRTDGIIGAEILDRRDCASFKRVLFPPISPFVCRRVSHAFADGGYSVSRDFYFDDLGSELLFFSPESYEKWAPVLSRNAEKYKKKRD